MKKILTTMLCLVMLCSFCGASIATEESTIYDPYYNVVEKLNREYGEELFKIINPNEELLQTPIDEYENKLRELQEYVLKEQPTLKKRVLGNKVISSDLIITRGLPEELITQSGSGTIGYGNYSLFAKNYVQSNTGNISDLRYTRHHSLGYYKVAYPLFIPNSTSYQFSSANRYCNATYKGCVWIDSITMYTAIYTVQITFDATN